MPEVTAEMWDNAEQAASEPGIHNPSGIAAKAVETFNKSKEVVDKVRNAKIFGFPVGTFLMGAVLGGATKAVLKSGLTASGLFGGIGLAATAGAVYETGKEYLKQRKSGSLETGVSSETGVKTTLKNELLRLKNTDKKKLAIAAGKGAVMGALGFGFGAYVVPEIISAASGLLSSDSIDMPTPTETLVAPSGVAPEVSTETPTLGYTPTETIPGSASTPGDLSPTETPTITPTETVDGADAVATATEVPSTETPTSTPTVTPDAVPDAGAATSPTLPSTSGETPYDDTWKPAPQNPPVSATPATPYDDTWKPTAQAPSTDNVVSVSHPEVKLPEGSNPWREVEKYMTDELSKNGKTLSETQLKDAVARAVADSNIQDATKLPVGYTINLSGADEIVKQAISGQPLLPLEIAQMPDTISLPPGSNPWEVSKTLLSKAMEGSGQIPTDAQILELDKRLCEINGFAAPELGISGDKLAASLQAGQKINIGPLKQLAVKIITK